MSKKALNLAVGTSSCPIRDCIEAVEVFKYRAGGGDEKRRRFAGRLYCVCPKHGRVENQEYLLEHVKWAAEKSATEPAPAAAATPAAVPQAAPKKAIPAQAPTPSSRAPPPAAGLSPWLADYRK